MTFLRDLGDLGGIRIARVGDTWIAWVEPSVHLTGSGDSPLAAMKALVERLRYAKLHRA